MKDPIGIPLIVLALLCSSAALASLKNIENAYETDAGRTTLPNNARGQFVIRECAACKPVVLRVNKETQYLLGQAREKVGLAALRAAVSADKNATQMITVFYNIDSGFVTRVVLGPAR